MAVPEGVTVTDFCCISTLSLTVELFLGRFLADWRACLGRLLPVAPGVDGGPVGVGVRLVPVRLPCLMGCYSMVSRYYAGSSFTGLIGCCDYRVPHLVGYLAWVDIDLSVPPPCPSARPFLPEFHQPRQSLAEGETIKLQVNSTLGVNSIEFQQTVQRKFQQGVYSYRVSCTLLKILLNIQLKFN